MKPSKTQRTILTLMTDGWELGTGLSGRCWIQKGGIGKGGESRTVHANTAYVLRQNKWIKAAKRKFPTTHWAITALGRKELKAMQREFAKEQL